MPAGEKYDPKVLWLWAQRSRPWASCLPAAVPADDVRLCSGRICAWRIRLYSHLLHYKYRLLLAASDFLRRHVTAVAVVPEGRTAAAFFRKRVKKGDVGQSAGGGSSDAADGALLDAVPGAKLLGAFKADEWDGFVDRYYRGLTALVDATDRYTIFTFCSQPRNAFTIVVFVEFPANNIVYTPAPCSSFAIGEEVLDDTVNDIAWNDIR